MHLKRIYLHLHLCKGMISLHHLQQVHLVKTTIRKKCCASVSAETTAAAESYRADTSNNAGTGEVSSPTSIYRLL